ncbi:MAG: GntR family transcriptional regulator [Candidatus Accumulibacter sp.]|jgi:DNA-binding GntR family transcriptional regulator|nr:GntR family transcriptional regulator [Accumulibacter sp.]
MNTSLLIPVPRGNLSQNELAYDSVKERIIAMAYKPGLYLNIAEMMHELSLGRTPINHALHRLSREGLLHIIPRKGVVVAPLSIDDALELIDVRIANEKLCGRLAAEKITADELKQLAGLLEEQEAAIAGNAVELAAGFDLRFHEEIARASRNQVLMEMLRLIHARSQRFWVLSFRTEGHLKEVQLEHRRILEALGRADPEAAAAAMEAHALSFKRSLLQAS